MAATKHHRPRQGVEHLSAEEIQREVADAVARVRTDNAEAELTSAVTKLFERGVGKSDATTWATTFALLLHQREEHEVIGAEQARALVDAMYGSSEFPNAGVTDEAAEQEREPKASKEDRLYAIAKRDLLLYKDSAGMFWAGIPVEDGSHDHIDLDSARVSSFLHARYRRDVHTVVGSDAVRNVLATIQGDLAEDETTHENFVRLAWNAQNGKLYVDLHGNKAAEIDADGWRVITDPPVYFRRPRGLLPQVEPTAGGSLNTLRDILRIRDDRTWHLLVAFLISAYHPEGPYPVLVLTGEQGSGKTTIAELLGRLIDPQKAQVRKAPTKEDDVPVQAAACHLLAWDNLSTVPGWFSDVLCGLATGLTETRRKLYSDADVYVFGAMRSTLVNGIEDLATRADLLSRALLVHLETMPHEQRKELDVVKADFEAARPSLLGAVFDAVSCSLRNKDRIVVKHPPRMADMANWVTRAEPALGWERGTYVTMFQTSVEEAASISLEASPLGQGLLQWLRYHPRGYDGYAASFLDELNRSLDINLDIRRRKGWPALPHFFTSELRRIAPSLRRQGWEVAIERERKGARVTLTHVSGDAGIAAGDAVPEVVVLPELAAGTVAEPVRDAGDAGGAVSDSSSVLEGERGGAVIGQQGEGGRGAPKRHEHHERFAGLRADVNLEMLGPDGRLMQRMPASQEQTWSVTVPRTASPCPTCGQPVGSSPAVCYECRAELVWREENSRCRHRGSFTSGIGAPFHTLYGTVVTTTQTCAECGTTFYCEEPEAHQTKWVPYGCVACDSEAARLVGVAVANLDALEEQAQQQRQQRLEELTRCAVCEQPSWPHDLCRLHLRLDIWERQHPDARQGGDPECDHVELREEGDTTLICDDCEGIWQCDHPALYQSYSGARYYCPDCGYVSERTAVAPERQRKLDALAAPNSAYQ